MQHDLILVNLNTEQISLAKEANGLRKEITHGLICGPHGQIFGTEQQCRKYYTAWTKVFPYLFSKGVEVNKFEIIEYKTTFNLVNILIELHDPLENTSRPNHKNTPKQNKKKSNLISRIWTSITGS